jgi:hypothetical protein
VPVVFANQICDAAGMIGRSRGDPLGRGALKRAR